MYQKLIHHYDKHKFLSDKFIYINKNYRSSERQDFEYNDKDSHNHFLLKQLKKSQIINSTLGITLEISYEWKVSYPANSSLHSFKHG